MEVYLAILYLLWHALLLPWKVHCPQGEWFWGRHHRFLHSRTPWKKGWIPPGQASKLAIMAPFWESASRLKKELTQGQSLWWLGWPLCEDEQPAANVFLWGTQSWACGVRHAQRIATGVGGTEEWHREHSSVGFQALSKLFPFGVGFLDSRKIGLELWTILVPDGRVCLPTPLPFALKTYFCLQTLHICVRV